LANFGKEKNAKLEYIGLTDEGTLNSKEFYKIDKPLKLFSFTHVSNTLGTINPAKDLTKIAHEAGAIVVLDGAQSVPHMPVNVREIDCDFMVFSGHKMLGPMGIGVLYAKKKSWKKWIHFLQAGR